MNAGAYGSYRWILEELRNFVEFLKLVKVSFSYFWSHHHLNGRGRFYRYALYAYADRLYPGGTDAGIVNLFIWEVDDVVAEDDAKRAACGEKNRNVR